VAQPLCDAYALCINTTSCADVDERLCYCGGTAENLTTCFASYDPNLPAGACRESTENLAGSNIPIQVGTYYYDSTKKIGAINQLIKCQKTNCSAECDGKLGAL
jgi:hypothetical protein